MPWGLSLVGAHFLMIQKLNQVYFTKCLKGLSSQARNQDFVKGEGA